LPSIARAKKTAFVFAAGDDLFGLSGFGDQFYCGCGDISFGADGGGEAAWQKLLVTFLRACILGD
jgi:hypothetical protein